MPLPALEDVYKLNGVPTFTLVKPSYYGKLLVALRTKARGVVIEGPSGIGKTTAVMAALEELGQKAAVKRLTPRKAHEIPMIEQVVGARNLGTVIIDDFHILPSNLRSAIADFLKTLADEERDDTKLVLVGINKTGDALVKFAEDLNNRIDVIRFEANPDSLVEALVRLGEAALNIKIACSDEIVAASSGSFYLAQMLCHEACIAADVLEARSTEIVLPVSFEVVNSRVVDKQASRFRDVAIEFARGNKLRREGRAPYLHALKWISEAEDWSVNLEAQARIHQELRGSVTQIVEKGYLEDMLAANVAFQKVLHFDSESKILTVEDPQFIYYLRNLNWNNFAKTVGFIEIFFDTKYDFALSFAGQQRGVAELVRDGLLQREIQVFYDKDEQHRILAVDVEDYLGPIYRTEATFVVCFLSKEYPNKIWTRFESQQFKARFGSDAVIPVWFSDAEPGVFDESKRKGGVILDVTKPIDAQVEKLVSLLAQKLTERRTDKFLQGGRSIDLGEHIQLAEGLANPIVAPPLGRNRRGRGIRWR